MQWDGGTEWRMNRNVYRYELPVFQLKAGIYIVKT